MCSDRKRLGTETCVQHRGGADIRCRGVIRGVGDIEAKATHVGHGIVHAAIGAAVWRAGVGQVSGIAELVAEVVHVVDPGVRAALRQPPYLDGAPCALQAGEGVARSREQLTLRIRLLPVAVATGRSFARGVQPGFELGEAG